MSAEPKKFRRKPYAVDAIRLPEEDDDASREFVEAIHDFLGPVLWFSESYGSIAIHQDDRIVGVQAGQWIVRNDRGEFTVCGPEVFAAMYEPAPPSSFPALSEEQLLDAFASAYFEAATNRSPDRLKRLQDARAAIISRLSSVQEQTGRECERCKQPMSAFEDDGESDLCMPCARNLAHAFMAARLTSGGSDDRAPGTTPEGQER